MNTLLSIWTKPTKTIEYVLANKTYSYGFIILLLASLSTGIVAFAGTGFLEDLPLIGIVLLSILLTYVIAIPAWFINAALYTWIGKMLGGTGKYRQMALIIPIGSIPTIWMLPFNVLVLILYGNKLFDQPTENFGITNMSIGLYILSNLILIGSGIYATVIMSKGIGLVHNFSAWRGFGTIMLLVLFVFILVIVFSVVVGIVLFILFS